MIGPPPIFSSHKDVPVFFLCPGVTESFVLEEKKRVNSQELKTTENKTSTKHRYSYPPLLSLNSPSHTNWTNDSKGSSWLFINSFSCAFRIVRMSASASETYIHTIISNFSHAEERRVTNIIKFLRSFLQVFSIRPRLYDSHLEPTS